MKKLQCELCGSVDIIKVDNDVFQCQSCGCKYTSEQAKALMLGEVIAHSPDFEIVAGKLVKYNGSERNVIVPEGVVTIGTVFKGLPIHSVFLPSTLAGLAPSAFEGCSDLEKVVFNSSLSAIPSNAFSWCSSLKYINIPPSVQTIGWRAFTCCFDLEFIELPSSVKTIEREAFSGCKRLSTININEGLEEIGSKAFYGCSDLKQVVFPSSISYVDKTAFKGCEQLNNVSFPDNVGIGVKAVFYDLFKEEIEEELIRYATSDTFDVKLFGEDYKAESFVNVNIINVGLEGYKNEKIEEFPIIKLLVDYARQHTDDFNNYEYLQKFRIKCNTGWDLGNVFGQVRCILGHFYLYRDPGSRMFDAYGYEIGWFKECITSADDLRKVVDEYIVDCKEKGICYSCGSPLTRRGICKNIRCPMINK